MHLNFFVSPKCFYYCKGCYSHSREENCDNIVSTDIIIKFLDYAYNKGVKKVTFCGGDPLTRSDILNLLEKTKKIGYYISLDTLGTTVIKSIINHNKVVYKKTDVKKLAKYINMIGVPIDGSNNEIINMFRQTNVDIINEQINICHKLNKFKIPICINTVIHKGNLEDIDKIVELLNQINYIKKWQIFEFIPSGKYGIINKDLFQISDNDFNKAKSRVKDNFDDINKVQFKDMNDRNKAYMLIDNSGNARISNYTDNSKRIIGNIKNSHDWDKICNYLTKKN